MSGVRKFIAIGLSYYDHAQESGQPAPREPVVFSKWTSCNTANMIFSCARLVSYCSRLMTLEPVDVIATSTPAGVGLGVKPPTFLKPGDVVEAGISRLGT